MRRQWRQARLWLRGVMAIDDVQLLAAIALWALTAGTLLLYAAGVTGLAVRLFEAAR